MRLFMAILYMTNANVSDTPTIRQADTDPRVPPDWGLPGWTAEQFERFNHARRKLHEIFQRHEKLTLGEIAVGREKQ